MTRWERYEGYNGLPRIAACYVIYVDRKVIYIGQTQNLRQRFSVHVSARNGLGLQHIDPARVTVKVNRGMRYGDWAMRELRLIKRLLPVGNCTGTDTYGLRRFTFNPPQRGVCGMPHPVRLLDRKPAPI